MENSKIIKLNTNKPKLISEDEINSIFIGLVRLIKKNYSYEYADKYKQKIDYLTDRLNDEIIKNKILQDNLLTLQKKKNKQTKTNKIK